MDYNCGLAFLNLLYKEPLYKFIGKDEENMNVLVIGWDSDGASAKFIDQCLQMGQMQDHYLNILVVSSNPDDAKENYLKERPAMSSFVNVYGSGDNFTDESSKDKETMYADLQFVKGPSVETLCNDKENSLMNILIEAGKEKYHYFLVSFGDDIINNEIADCLIDVTNILMPAEDNAIHYVVKAEKNNNDNREDIGTVPVYINATSDTTEIDQELIRMAFNAHLLWANSDNTDYQEEYKKFKTEAYNFSSLINNAATPEERKKLEKEAYNISSSIMMAASIKYKLKDIGIEWGDTYETAYIFEKKVSEDENILNQVIWLEHRRWVLEKAEDGWQYPQCTMDDFCEGCCERMMVKDDVNKIHPCMVRSKATKSISETIYDHDRKLWDKGNTQTRRVDLDDLDKMSLKLHRAMNQKADRNRGQSIKDLNEYYQYFKKYETGNRYHFCVENILDRNVEYSKQYDRYKNDLLHFIKSNNRVSEEEKNLIENGVNEISKDIWPVIQANLCIDYKSYDKVLVRGISFILTYRTNLSLAMPFAIDRQNVVNSVFSNVASVVVIKPQKLTYLLFLDDRAQESIFNQTLHNCCDFMRAKNNNCDISIYLASTFSIENKTIEDINNIAGVSINAYICENENAASKKFEECLNNESPDLYDYSNYLFNIKSVNTRFEEFINKYAHFCFNSNNKEFTETYNCCYLKYINDSASLSVDEMFYLAGVKMNFDYPFLESPRIYEKLWDIYTGRYRDTQDILASIECWNDLIKNCKFTESPISREEIESNLGRKHINFDKIEPLLNEMIQDGIIKKDEQNSETVYMCDDESIVTVLSKEGKVLETCLYYAICEEGGADYLASGIEIEWPNNPSAGNGAKNELDLIVIKGFNSVLVQCKGTKAVKPDVYGNLDSLARRLEVGDEAQKALVTTANVNPNRGDPMNIKTIIVTENIHDVAKQVLELLDK